MDGTYRRQRKLRQDQCCRFIGMSDIVGRRGPQIFRLRALDVERLVQLHRLVDLPGKRFVFLMQLLEWQAPAVVGRAGDISL